MVCNWKREQNLQIRSKDSAMQHIWYSKTAVSVFCFFTWSNFSALSLFAFSDTLFSFPFLEDTLGTEKQMCTACSSSTCDGEVFRRYSKVIFCLLRAWCSWALFHLAHRKSQQQMWKSFHRLTLHLHRALNGAALHHSLSPCTVMMWPFKPCGKFGTHKLFALTFTVLLTTENGSICEKKWRFVCVLLTCKCCNAEMWIYSIYGAFNETWL